MITPEVLGRRIKNFRLRKDISQLDLESYANLSPGTLSRVENGKINPMKETVIRIAEVMKLNSRELDYLIGKTVELPTEIEVQKAVDEIKGLFGKFGFVGYLLDDRWRFHQVSNYFMKILGSKPEVINRVIGATTVEVIVDDSYPVINFLAKSHYEELLDSHISYYISQCGFMEDDESFIRTRYKSRQHPIAKSIWDKYDTQKGREFNSIEKREVWFNLFLPLNQKMEVRMKFSREPLFNESRFEVVEYYLVKDLMNIIG